MKRAEIGGTNGGTDWSQPWSRVHALAELCVPPKAYEATLNLRQRIEMVLDEALAGRLARLTNDSELGEHRTPLLNVVARVRHQTEKVGLNSTQSMYPVLWVRLLLEAGVELEGRVYRQLGEWRLRCEAEGAVVFALADFSARNPRASSRIVPGRPYLKYARTVEELLLRPTGPNGEPYTQTWKLYVIPRSHPGVEASTSKLVSAKTAAAETKKKPRRKEKTMEYFNKLCGSGVMENLDIALRLEAESKRGLVVVEGNHRYRTELSSDELCKTLKRNQGTVLTGSDSTLHKALGAYVTLPRGRPPRKQPAPKKLR